jgi:hypothetical protein
MRTLCPPDDGTHNIIHPLNLDPGKLQREPLVAEYYSRSRGPLELAFPPLEDADSIQLAISMVITALGQNRLDTRRAGSMLYALQVASSNVHNLNRTETCVVRDTVFDDAGNLLSPDEDPEEVRDEQLFLQEFSEAEARVIEEDEDYEPEDQFAGIFDTD